MMCSWPAASRAAAMGASLTNCGRAPTTLRTFTRAARRGWWTRPRASLMEFPCVLACTRLWLVAYGERGGTPYDDPVEHRRLDMTGAVTRGLHVLYVAWGFPPHVGPGVSRSLATVAELVRQGHRVTVLTADLATFDVVFGGDRSLLDEIPQAVRVARVAMAAEPRDPLLNRWSAGRIEDPKVWATKVAKEQVRAFPEEVYGTWQPRAEAVAHRIHELDPVDLVIATGDPYVDFSVALRLHVDHGVPFVLDDRDSSV